MKNQFHDTQVFSGCIYGKEKEVPGHADTQVPEVDIVASALNGLVAVRREAAIGTTENFGRCWRVGALFSCKTRLNTKIVNAGE